MNEKICSRCKQSKNPEEFDGLKTCRRCREYNQANRAYWRKSPNPTKGKGRTPAVVMGRRFCSTCKRWRHICDFGVQTWNDPIEQKYPLFFRNICHHCERIRKRTANVKSLGRKPYGQRKPKMSKQERNRRHRERHMWRMENDPAYAENFRERQRIWAEGKRREKGIARRNRPDRRTMSNTYVDGRPFVEWWDSLNGMRPKEPNVDSDAMRAVRRVKNGESTRINLAHVDHLCMAAGFPEELSILYPD
jgi:FtsZ-interacting cell division protein YlmF